ncbi:DUF1189 domain-containing protein [Clostridium manihotivorum]|nr:DUF1189 domain-containing protein [Clostridium manihotivorum]
MDKNISFVTKFYKSMTSPKFYIKFNQISLAAAVVYLFTISLILGLIGYIRPTLNYYRFMDTIHHEVVYDFPEFNFSNGILKVDGKQPILLRKSDYYILIDTTGKTKVSDIEKYNKSVLILKDKAFIKNGDKPIDETRYSIIKFLHFDKKQFIQSMYDFKAGSFIILIAAPVLFFVSNLFTAFIVSMLGTLVNATLKAGIKYINLYKLSIYSITTSMVLSCIRRILGINIIFINYVYIIIGFIYLFLAIRNILISEAKNMEE